MDLFTKNILNSKVKLKDEELLAHHTFLSTLPHETWVDVLEPALIKLMRKAPESSSQIVAFVCATVQDDFSKLVKEAIATSCIRMLKVLGRFHLLILLGSFYIIFLIVLFRCSAKLGSQSCGVCIKKMHEY